MSLQEIESLVAELPRNEQEQLLRSLASKLDAASTSRRSKPSTAVTPMDRTQWLKRLEQRREQMPLLPPGSTQAILDQLREDRI